MCKGLLRSGLLHHSWQVSTGDQTHTDTGDLAEGAKSLHLSETANLIKMEVAKVFWQPEKAAVATKALPAILPKRALSGIVAKSCREHEESGRSEKVH